MKDPKKIIEQWVEAVNSANVENLLALYDSQAVLIPTFSNKLLNSPDKLREYFNKVANLKKLSITLNENTLFVQAVEKEVFVIGGYYDWQFWGDNELLKFEARFTYIIDTAKTNPILHHHSSQIPRKE